MLLTPWYASYPSIAAGKTALILASLLLGVGATLAATPAASQLSIESGPGRAGALQWQSLDLELHPGNAGAAAGAWSLTVAGVNVAGFRGALRVNCSEGRLSAGYPRCAQGEFEWRGPDDGSRLSGRLTQSSNEHGLRFELDGGGLSGQLEWPSSDQQALQLVLQAGDFDLAALPAQIIEPLGLSVLEGRANGQLRFTQGRLELDIQLAGVGFDRKDGRVAGADMGVSLRGTVDGFGADSALRFSGQAAQHAGELLIGPVYLPPPEQPLELQLAGSWLPGETLRLDTLTFKDGELLEADASLVLIQRADAWSIERADIERVRLQLPGAWQRWGEGLVSARGLGGLETTGQITGSARWHDGGLTSLELALDNLSVTDPSERFALSSLNGHLQRLPGRFETELSWQGLALYRLAFGASSLQLAGQPQDWRLARPLRLPLLDGALVLDRLEMTSADSQTPVLSLDARIEPLDLALLTRMLGLPEFGGELSGAFPGVELEGERITFSGGIDVQAFSGAIRLEELVIERPFGSLPALAAQVEIDRLDLSELTGAFNFGHMGGRASGWVRNLRLLDWRPVAMDARLYTHDDAPGRRISQRAVENLSRLGGGAAALGATLLRMFEEFPYRRAGLACRLDRNICHIDGVAPHESGGFYIVQGRGLPHLDVVGHRRLIDWPRLVAQLVAITEG